MRSLRFAAVIAVAVIVTNASAYSQVKPRISWRLPIVPIEISIDSQGNIDVSSSASWVTPIGEFSLGISTPLREETSLLTLLVDGKKYKYRIGGKKFEVSARGLRLLRLSNDEYGNVTVLATRDLQRFEMETPRAGNSLIGAWQGGYSINGVPVTEVYTFTRDGYVYDRIFNYLGNLLSEGVGRYAYSGGTVNIYWGSGMQEAGAVRWMSNESFDYNIISHSQPAQIGLEIVFQRTQ